jgi:hypothetical protein
METNQLQEEIKGAISLKLANNYTLDDLCAAHIDDYNRDRFEAFAIRVFLGNETVITIYAVDKIRQEDSIIKKDRLPVKKFKLVDVPLESLFSYCSAFNFTATTGNYELDDMEVTNR